MKRLIRPLLLLLLLLLLAVLLPMRRVGSDEMAWTLQRDDLIWVLPVRVRKGDVIVMDDPLDPARTVLRRVIGLPGEKIRYEDGSIKVNGKRIRQTDMDHVVVGEVRYKTFKEVIWSRPPARATSWLVTHTADRPVAYSMPDKVEVPAEHWFVLADSRDRALDSRWWGPIPQSAVKGVVRMRLSARDRLREPWAWLAPIE